MLVVRVGLVEERELESLRQKLPFSSEDLGPGLGALLVKVDIVSICNAAASSKSLHSTTDPLRPVLL